MKKNGIINADISRVLSYMGHTDQLCIGDCGLPIPDEVERIDLALTLGVPSFMQVLREVKRDMKIERIILASEIQEQNVRVLDKIYALFEGENIEVVFVPHVEFKEATGNCKAIVRTGEVTPYANIILQSGCLF